MSDISTTRIFTDGEKGITAAKLNDIIAGSSIQTSFVASKPVISTVNPTDDLLVLTAGGTYAQAPFSTIVDSVNTQLPSSDSEIWSVRLRSFNSVKNSNFEVTQRNVSNVISNPVHGTMIEDRWAAYNNNLLNPSFQVIKSAASLAPGGGALVPGTNFAIGNGYLRIICQTVKSSLAATDLVGISQVVEGPMLRELQSDVHSISLLVRSSVANLKFGLCLRDPTSAHFLTKLCTLGTANTLNLITLPNLPLWTSSGTFTSAIGSIGYLLSIILAAGANYTSPANDTWQNGGFMGAIGQSNFLSGPVSSTFDVLFVQHEPGPVCSTLMDNPFTQNYDECLRYYQKSYDYETLPGTATGVGTIPLAQQTTTLVTSSMRFHKPLAKTPTMVGYSTTGTINSIRFAPSDYAITSFTAPGKAGFWQITTATLPAVALGATGNMHYTADTGW